MRCFDVEGGINLVVFALRCAALCAVVELREISGARSAQWEISGFGSSSFRSRGGAANLGRSEGEQGHKKLTAHGGRGQGTAKGRGYGGATGQGHGRALEEHFGCLIVCYREGRQR